MTRVTTAVSHAVSHGVTDIKAGQEHSQLMSRCMSRRDSRRMSSTYISSPLHSSPLLSSPTLREEKGEEKGDRSRAYALARYGATALPNGMGATAVIDLFEIRIRLNELDDGNGHTEINTETIDYAQRDVLAQHSYNEIAEAARYVAGIMARVAAELSLVMLHKISQCGCFNDDSGCCIIGIQMLNPAEDFGSGPGVSYIVPTAEVEEWTKRIHAALAEAVRSDGLDFAPDASVIF